MWGNDADYLPISPVMVGSPLRTNPRGHIHKNVLVLGAVRQKECVILGLRNAAKLVVHD